MACKPLHWPNTSAPPSRALLAIPTSLPFTPLTPPQKQWKDIRHKYVEADEE